MAANITPYLQWKVGPKWEPEALCNSWPGPHKLKLSAQGMPWLFGRLPTTTLWLGFGVKRVFGGLTLPLTRGHSPRDQRSKQLSLFVLVIASFLCSLDSNDIGSLDACRYRNQKMGCAVFFAWLPHNGFTSSRQPRRFASSLVSVYSSHV